MHLLSLLLPALSFLSGAVRADNLDSETPLNTRSVTLHKWPLSAASPIPLGTVGYNPRTGTGEFEVVKVAGDVLGDDEVVRVGVWDGKEGWFGCITAGVSVWPTLEFPEPWLPFSFPFFEGEGFFIDDYCV